MARNAVVSLIITAKDLTGRAIRGAVGGIKGMANSLTSFKTLAAGLAGGALARLTIGLFRLGSTAEETQSKFTTVFGESQDAVQEFNDTFGQLAGLSRTQAQELTSTTGAIVQGMGFMQDASADAAIEIVRLGADLASFNNLQGGTEQGVNRINAALAGEFESLKRLGIVLRAADVDQRALIISGKDSVTQLTEQDRVTARLQLITERAGVAVGDLERTQTSLANQSRRLSGQLRTTREDMGKMFIEAFRLTGGFDDQITVTEKLTNFIDENRTAIVAWVAVIIEGFKSVLSALKTGFTVIKNLIEIAVSGFSGFGLIIGAIFRRDFAALPAIVEGVKDSIAGDLNDIVVAAENTAEAIDRVVDAAKRAVMESQGIDTGIAAAAAAAGPTPGGGGGPTEEDLRTQRLEALRAEVESTTEEVDLLITKFDLGLISSSEFANEAERLANILKIMGANADITDRQLIDITKSLQSIGEQTTMIRGQGVLMPGLEKNLSLLQDIGKQLQIMFGQGEALALVFANIASTFLTDFGGAVESAFSAVVSGSESAGTAFKNAMLGAIASVARAQGQLFLAEAAASLGRGFLGQPGGFAAAGKFLLAASLMFALAGGLGGAARGGGGGGGAAGGTAEEQRDNLRDERPEGEIIIQGGILDMSDPRQQDALAKAVEDLTGRRIIVSER